MACANLWPDCAIRIKIKMKKNLQDVNYELINSLRIGSQSPRQQATRLISCIQVSLVAILNLNNTCLQHVCQLWWQRCKFTFHKWMFCFVLLIIRSWMKRHIFTSNCLHEISLFWIDEAYRLLNNFYWLECPGSGTSSIVYYYVALHITWQLKVQDVV